MSCTDMIATLAPDMASTADAHDATALRIRAVIAQELEGIAVILEAIGEQLCGDPQIVKMHLAALQSIDELCQRHQNLARTLRAEDMESAVNGITLDSLRARLVAALAQKA